MRSENLAQVDLNLLVALDALLRTQSVTLASRELGLSQPAVSRALGRLRELLDDPILTRAGHVMVPTPRALALAEPLGTALDAVRRTLEPPGDFDPSNTARSFVIGAVDTTQSVILPPLLAHMGKHAPGVDVSTAPLHSTQALFEMLASGERDFGVGRFERIPDGVRQEFLYRDELVCLVRRNHPRIRGRLTLERYLAESHLAAESTSPLERPYTIESLLAARGLTRRVACTLQNLAMAPFVVARSDLVCSAPGRTILPFAKGLGLRVLAPPFEAPAFDLQLVWHERNHADGGHTWLRGVLLGLFAASG